MNLLYVALASGSEENADKFYRDLLGLRKAAPKALSSSLARAIFNIDSDFSMINYMDESVHFEVFVKTGEILTPSGEDSAGSDDASRAGGNRRIDHVCLQVERTSGNFCKNAATWALASPGYPRETMS
jgi:hypothetical protein